MQGCVGETGKLPVSTEEVEAAKTWVHREAEVSGTVDAVPGFPQ